MSITNNALVAVAVAAAGLGNMTLGAPIVESLLDQVEVSAVNAVEVTDKGKALVLVTMKDEQGAPILRPVATATGDVKLFADAGAVMAFAKKSNLPGGQPVTVIKRANTGSVGDPIAALKAQHKAAVREAAAAGAAVTSVTQKVTAAVGLHWNTDPQGSATRAEYDDLAARKSTVEEWKTAADARVATLAASLAAAGIDPVTYLPTAH